MAAPGGGCVRVRLFFDYPPPGTPECCMCWLLVDAKKCRVVADLGTVIRQKFGFSERSLLSLFVDDCLLPPSESIMVVRDNDCIRVKLEEMKTADSVAETWDDFAPLMKSRKRQRPKSEDELGNPEERQRKKKKRKQKSETPSAQQLKPVHDQKRWTKRKNKEQRNAKTSTAEEEDSSSSEQSKKRKPGKEMDSFSKNKRMKAAEVSEGQLGVEPSSKTVPLSLSKGDAAKKGVCESGKQTSKSKSSITSPDDDLTKSSKGATKKKDQICPVSSPADKITVTPKTGKAARTVTSEKTEDSSSDSDSSTEEVGSPPKKNCALVNNHSPVRNSVTQPQREKSRSGSVDSSSSHSDTSVIKRQKPGLPSPSEGWDPGLGGNGDAQVTNNVWGPAPKPQGYGRGVGRGRGDVFPWRGSRGYGDRRGMRGRGRGQTNHFFYNYNGESQKLQQINEIVTNSSVVIQNPPEVPKKDYSVLPLLAAPPQVGEKIAFKLLELTENYTPEVSDYKEGKILSYSPVTHQVDLELLSLLPVVKEPGKFDLVYQSEDGTDVIEFAVSQDTKITEKWDSLIEPRLLVETSSDQAESTEPMKTT